VDEKQPVGYTTPIPTKLGGSGGRTIFRKSDDGPLRRIKPRVKSIDRMKDGGLHERLDFESVNYRSRISG
jgi:hypothetical protein